MMLTTTEHISDLEMETLGLVQGSTIQSKNIGRDITQGLKTLVGGELRAYNEMMKRNYRYEIGKIEGQAIDVAFVPLDPRQEEQYYWGMDYFMKHTDTKVVFPMHMWGHYEVWERLMENPEASSYRDKVMRITKAPQEFEIG